ncbi:MAG: hypothetical protein D6755_08360 [Anaerolineae bacterium]|nr:MAG: hypothetical protein D6755_08360 [Anaerolineae bacterium]
MNCVPDGGGVVVGVGVGGVVVGVGVGGVVVGVGVGGVVVGVGVGAAPVTPLQKPPVRVYAPPLTVPASGWPAVPESV